MSRQSPTRAAHPLDSVVSDQKAGRPVGVTSIGSAHPLVLEAGMRQALADGGLALIETTSSQVDQTGGHTGLRPVDFRNLVHAIAGDIGLSTDRIVLGGHHLGPNRWRALPSEIAMGHAEVLVGSYVAAGFTKIHLDCSSPCADDVGGLTHDVVATRAVRLLRVAEGIATAVGRPGRLRYVIGSEIPAPGDTQASSKTLDASSARDVRATLSAHRAAFAATRLDHLWPQVMALVVRPGVELDHHRVSDDDRNATAELRLALDGEPSMVFEAHSTDYQVTERLRELVEHRWAVLKAGPGLSYALREALLALAAVEDVLVAAHRRSHLRDVVEKAMRTEPDHRHARHYWSQPAVCAAQDRLLDNLSAVDVPVALLSHYLPVQHHRIRNKLLDADPRAIVVDRVRDVLRDYAAACGQSDLISS